MRFEKYIKFKEYMRESKFYRGYAENRGIFGKNTHIKNIIWFTSDINFAKSYNKLVVELEYTPKKIFKAGHDKRKIKITELLMEMLKQSGKQPDDEMRKLIPQLRKEYGNSSQKIINYWIKNDSTISDLLRLFSFDSIELKEKGIITIGILREHIKMTKIKELNNEI